MCRYSATLGSTERSSSYPWDTTACSLARVTESPLANSVTSHPRATSPSATLLATVSHAPYCRGGVRQATGDRIAILFFDNLVPLLQQRLGVKARQRKLGNESWATKAGCPIQALFGLEWDTTALD